MWNTANWNWSLSLWRELQVVHRWSKLAKTVSTFATVSRGSLIVCANEDSVTILILRCHKKFWDLLYICEGISMSGCICLQIFCVPQNAVFYWEWHLSNANGLSYLSDYLTCYDVFIRVERTESYSLEFLNDVRRRIFETVHSKTNNASMKTVFYFLTVYWAYVCSPQCPTRKVERNISCSV